MPRELIEKHLLEISCGAVAAAMCVATGVQLASGDMTGLTVACGSLAGVGIGGLAGSLLRFGMDAKELARARERAGELEGRPTSEEHAKVLSELGDAKERLLSAESALSAQEAELAQARSDAGRMAAALQDARVTASLDRFSDFQLLGMCDVFDAEAARGYLERPYGDPAMEQLLALGAVSFDSTQDDRGLLKWTLDPEWRQAVSAQRDAIDARTESLRARRVAAGE